MWDKYYSEQQYKKALSYHNEMTEGDDKYFALGNDYYRLWAYKDSAQAFSDIQGYKWLYNAGNAFFRFGEETSTLDDRIQFWERSLEFYEESLQDTYTLEAQNNANLVRNKLEELEKETKAEENQQDENQQQQNQTEETSWEEPQDNAQEPSESWQEGEQTEWGESGQSQKSDDTSQAPIPQPRWEQYKLWEWSEVPEITQWEKASLERYIDALQQEEIQNQRYFNKQWNHSSSQNAFDVFFDQFGSFDTWRSSWEKDW